MRDQHAKVKECLIQDIPCIVITGDDVFAMSVLQQYLDEAQKGGCSEQFKHDILETIREFKVHRRMHPERLKIPN